MDRVAITGLGHACSLGADLATSWPRLIAGDHGFAAVSRFDARQYSCQVAAEALGITPDLTAVGLPLDVCRRTVRLFLTSAQEAWRDAGLEGVDTPPHRLGVATATSVNYLHMGTLERQFALRRPDRPAVDVARAVRVGCQPSHGFHRRQGDMMGSLTAKLFGLGGPVVVSDTACAASGFAIGEAFRCLRRGEVDVMLAGGACGIVSPFAIIAFALLGALSSNPDPALASRPFDLERDGFVMGEGGGTVVLERWEHARARGARIYAELAGYGTTSNAGTLTDPSPGGECEAAAMRFALRDAGLAPEAVDYVAAHGTSTPKNDAIETMAIKRVFGEHARRLAVSSNKGQIGHTITAAGVSNLVFTVKAMREGVVPPTAHYRTPDPACDLDYVPNVARRAQVGAALINAFAFGGQNAVLAVRQPAEAA